MASYVASVGMEVHAELATRSKMFCRCPVAFGGEPNTRVCPVCLGLPGSLPVPNHAAIQAVLKTALALNCKIAMHSIFHRKNYFYPDLPKGYQVSQYGETNPLGYGGYLELPGKGETRRIKIRRVHLEEDTGKLMHLPNGGSGIDYNRAGVPLMEIVTDFPPDIETPDQAREYLVALRQILLYLGVCDGKMEEGSLRCEPNISIRPIGAEKYGVKTELKNLNSFKSVTLGVAFEVRRQTAVIDGGGTVAQETRGWNEAKESSFAMRLKEQENDYRYFPDPDLVPMAFVESDIEALRSALPELPNLRAKRYRDDLGLSDYDAGVLTAEKAQSDYFDEAVAAGGEPKAVCNWMTGELNRLLNEKGMDISDSKVKPVHILDIIALTASGKVNGKTAKALFAEAFTTGEKPSELLAKSGATQISDASQIQELARKVVDGNPDVVGKFKAGQLNVIGFLVGQVMKESGGRANPAMVGAAVQEELNKK